MHARGQRRSRGSVLCQIRIPASQSCVAATPDSRGWPGYRKGSAADKRCSGAHRKSQPAMYRQSFMCLHACMHAGGTAD
jgi:hypothetical protein